jgi:Zn ribbon nucleic-acid-binding protein
MTITAPLELSTAEELAIAVERGGGTMTLADENIELFLPDDLAHLLPELKEHKPEILALLRRIGGRIVPFPMCPKCGAYCLYRERDVGLYECQRCGLQGIEERDARIASFLADSRAPQRGM